VIIYNKDGSIASKQFRKYDKKGNRIIFWTSSGASLESEDTLWISKNTYVYDSDSNIVESNDGSVKTISKYDKKGRNTELDSYDNKEKLISSRIFKYDEKGDCLSDCVTDNYQKVQISVCWTYKYDERGDQIERSYFPSPEKPERIFTRSFDKGHNLIEVQSTRGPEDHLKYGYDNKGNLTEEFNYDSKDHILESIRYQYINFDTHGNWLKKITFKNGSIKNIVEREITYYQ
jgi:hypothetical protein